MARVERCHSIADLRRRARRRLPHAIWEFLEGGSDDEWSLRNNRQAFERYALLPRALADVREIDTSATVLGLPLATPVLLAPTGMSRMYHDAGEMGAARAAARAGTLYALSTYSSQTLEAVAGAAEGPKLFQLFTNPGFERALGLVDRARDAGYAALCLTIDTTTEPNKERDVRNGLTRGRLSARSLASFVTHPRWALGLLRGGPPQLANLGIGAWRAGDLQWREAHCLDWDQARRIRDRWPRPFALKGMLSLADAERAASLGVDALILSNHGGRQLDTVPAPVDLVAPLAEALGGRLEILVDSGIRRGTDVLKALALGAKGCFVGRAYLYGLAAGGEAGVDRALAILDEELRRDLRLVGARSLAALDRSLLWREPGSG